MSQTFRLSRPGDRYLLRIEVKAAEYEDGQPSRLEFSVTNKSNGRRFAHTMPPEEARRWAAQLTQGADAVEQTNRERAG